ncbi:MAG: hypothetical protein PVJ55_08480 [Anaerolineae bacterium]
MRYRKTVCIVWPVIALLTLVAQAGSPTVPARLSNRVGLVVGFGDGTFTRRCVTFSEAQISGYEALMRSDLDVRATGGAVCRIEETGCPTDDCFCAMPDYWSYWRMVDGTWEYSQSGALGTTVQDGDVDGWNWGAEPPPTLQFDQICSPFAVYMPLVLTGRAQLEP